MKYLKVDFYDDFTCIGSKCPDTCCMGWQIFIDNAAVQDYQSVPGPFGEKLKKSMHRQQNNVYMKLNADDCCPFLDTQNLCEIYRELGPERMCYVCRIYPRVLTQYEDLTLVGLDISCPEVARMLFSRTDPIQVDFWEDDTPAHGADDDGLFNLLINGLITSINILTDRSLSFSVRLRLLLLFNDALQECLDMHTDPASLFADFSSPEKYAPLAETLLGIATDHVSQILLLRQLEQYEGLTKIAFLFQSASAFYHPDLVLQKEAFRNLFVPFTAPPYTIQYENYIVNYLLNSYLDAHHSRNVRDKITIMLYLYVLQMTADMFILATKHDLPDLNTQTMIFSKTARFFNHNSKRLQKLYQGFLENGLAETTKLLTLI